MPRTLFTDPALQAVYDCLAPAESSPPADTAEAIAAREGLDLATELAAARRRAAGTTVSPRQTDRRSRRDDQRSLEGHALTVLSRVAKHRRSSELRALARAWAGTKLWPVEMEAWILAVGVDGPAIARNCRTAGIALSAMNVSMDGVRVKHHLRGGEPAFAVLARATGSGHRLSD